MISRRHFRNQLIAARILPIRDFAGFSRVADFPPTRVITKGPRYHWFGYYDKLQFDPFGRFVPGMRVPFEHRSPAKDDVIEIGMADPHDHYQWILDDTYPTGPERLQPPHLFHVSTSQRVDLGHFHLPEVYTGELRIDTHPRLSLDGKTVCIDAPHGNDGRQMHLIDISQIVARE